MKYIDRIKQDEADKLSEEQQYQNEDNKSQLDADLTVTERRLKELGRELDTLKSVPVLSAGDILAKQDEIAATEAGIKSLKALIAELF